MAFVCLILIRIPCVFFSICDSMIRHPLLGRGWGSPWISCRRTRSSYSAARWTMVSQHEQCLNVFALGAPGSQLPTTGPPFLEWLGLVHFCGKSPMLAVRRVNSAARPWIDKITEGLLSDWNQANPDERVSDSPDNFEASYIRCPMIPMACLLEDHLR